MNRRCRHADILCRPGWTLLVMVCGTLLCGGTFPATRVMGGEPGVAPLTVAEKSDYRATSRSEDVVAFLDQIVAQADHVRRVDFGKTVEGRPMVAAVVARPAVIDPATLADDPRAVVLVLGNIHSGECAGKEALLMLLRQLAQQPDHPWLENLVLVFVPNYNADANDRQSKDNRPGQHGPIDGMGQRANAQGFDLNRDFMKVDSPECRALLDLINRWDPHLLIDTHTTNGSQHRYALTYDVPHNPAAPEAVRKFMRNEMMPEITRRLDDRGIATFYYGNFNREHTRWSTFGDSPRFGTEYVGLRGRMSILAEAYAYISYRERIVATREFVSECLQYAAGRAADIRHLLDGVRERATAAGVSPQAGDQVAVRSEVGPLDQKVVVKGYQLISGEGRPRVDTSQPQDHTVEFYTVYQPTLQVQRPFAYLLPPDQRDVAERLQRHGVQMDRLQQDVTLEIERYQFTSLELSRREYQGHRLMQVEVQPATQQRAVPAGTIVVRTAQPLSNLIVYLLEPASDDGFVAWNLFAPELAAGTIYPVVRLVSPTDLPLEPVTMASLDSD